MKVFILFSFLSIFSCLIGQGNHQHEGGMHTMAMHRPKYPWANPNIPISVLPSLMGKQMGVVETPGIPPLGYKMEGNVKVFHLIAITYPV